MPNYGVPAKVSVAKAKTPTYKRSNFGVTRLQHDSYRGLDWYAICKAIRIRDNGCCKYCGLKENPKERIWHDVHHIQPLSRGGTTTGINLCLVCKDCHQLRHPHHKLGSRTKVNRP